MKKCLIVENSCKEESHEILEEVKAFLAAKDVECSVFSYDGILSGDIPLKADFSGCDFAVTLGGDGTVLFASRECAPYGIPVFSINLGVFGFLASVQKETWKEELSLFLEGKTTESLRSLIDVEVVRSSKTAFISRCLNDAVVSVPSYSGLMNLEVAYNRSLLGVFKATGLITATPTGSTAFSAAAGGPILEPSIDAMVLTPISSFSLSSRPLVFGSRGEIAMTVLPSRAEGVLSVDGQIKFNLKTGDVIILGISPHKARLAGASQEKFYASLKNKLNWSGGIRA